MNVGGGDAAIPQCLSPNLNLFEIVDRRRGNNLRRSTHYTSEVGMSETSKQATTQMHGRMNDNVPTLQSTLLLLISLFAIFLFLVHGFRSPCPAHFSFATCKSPNTIDLRCGHRICPEPVFCFLFFLFRCVPRPRAHLFAHKRFFSLMFLIVFWWAMIAT